MMLLHRLASVLRWMVRRKRAEHELDDELWTFVDMAADDRINEGSTPHEARRLAVLQLGGVELFGESGPAGADRWGRNRRPCRCGGIAPVWVGGRVYERATSPRALGFGLVLAPTALAALRQLQVAYGTRGEAQARRCRSLPANEVFTQCPRNAAKDRPVAGGTPARWLGVSFPPEHGSNEV